MSALCQFDRDVLTLWVTHGIPNDRSTLEYAGTVALKLWADLQESETAFTELLNATQPIR